MPRDFSALLLATMLGCARKEETHVGPAGEHNEIAISQLATATVWLWLWPRRQMATNEQQATSRPRLHCWQNNFSVSVRIWEQCRRLAWLRSLCVTSTSWPLSGGRGTPGANKLGTYLERMPRLALRKFSRAIHCSLAGEPCLLAKFIAAA